MATEEKPDLETLIARIAASRIAVAADLTSLRHRMDFRTRVKDSILAKPVAWLGGSLGAGFLVSALFKRRRRAKSTEAAKVKGGLWGMLLGGAFTLARPALQSWALREFQTRFAQPRYSQDKHP
ncbi:hypothetical protein [Luteolibacter sp. Populi]|uniref:hypothetical protein n=1 Tax=Luteolibacter sp. Populi TaxID=3230487 RepID=UPI0034671504